MTPSIKGTSAGVKTHKPSKFLCNNDNEKILMMDKDGKITVWTRPEVE
jgi:hypothetical protein